MHPEPVPTSTMRSRAFFGHSAAAREFEHSLHGVFSFGPRNQDVGVDLEIEPPEFLLAGDVLRGLAGASLLNQQEVALGCLAAAGPSPAFE